MGPFLSAVHVQKVIGPLLCDVNANRIILVARSMPIVQAWSLEGDSLWRSALAEFEQVMFTVDEQRTLRPVPPSELGDRIARSVVSLDSSTVLAQYEVWPGGAQTFSSIESRAFDVRTGHELARTTLLPTLDALSGELAYSRHNQPFPQVVVLKRRRN